MPTFVVTLRLPDEYDEGFIALIPRHRDFINRLPNERVVEVYAISRDRRRGWVTMYGVDAAAVQAVVEQFPLYRYLHGVKIDKLFVYDSTASRFPQINLNQAAANRFQARIFVTPLSMFASTAHSPSGFKRILPVGIVALLAASAAAPPLTTEQLTARMSAAIEGLKTLRCTVKAQERIGGSIHQARSIMKLTYKPLRIYIKNQKGVEVLWVAGQNGGDAWVYPAAFPYVTLSLNPNGKLMRGSQHHTALQAGFGTISDLLRTTGLRQDNTFSRSFRYTGDTLLLGRTCYVLRSDYPQFRYVSYKAGKNETIGTVAERFGCGEYRIIERNNLSIGESLAEGQVLQVPNAYGRRTTLCIDPKTYLPTLVQVNDEKGLFERFEFLDVIPNQPIPLEEFSKDYKGYKL